MEGVRRIDEWSRIRDRIPTLDVIVKFADQPTERAKGVNLTPDEWRVFARINGLDNIAAVAQLTNLSEFDVCRIIYGFIQAGLVEVARSQVLVDPEVQSRVRALVEESGGNVEAFNAAATDTHALEGTLAGTGVAEAGVPGSNSSPPLVTAQVGARRGVIFRIIDRIRRI